MLSNSRNRCDHPKSGALRNVLQLYERVLKRAVSVYTNQNSPSPVAVNHVQSVDRHGRDSAGIRWHGDNSHVVLRHRDLVEIQPAIGQIDGNGILVQRSSHKARHLLRSTRRTKHNFEYAHLDTLPLRSATRQAVFTSSQSIRHVGPRFNAPSTPMHPPYAVCLFVLYKLRYRLYIFTGYRRVLPRYPILARAKNGEFCNVTAPAPPRMGKTVGRRILLSPDMARMTRPCSGKRRNLTQNAR